MGNRATGEANDLCGREKRGETKRERFDTSSPVSNESKAGENMGRVLYHLIIRKKLMRTCERERLNPRMGGRKRV